MAGPLAVVEVVKTNRRQSITKVMGRLDGLLHTGHQSIDRATLAGAINRYRATEFHLPRRMALARTGEKEAPDDLRRWRSCGWANSGVLRPSSSRSRLLELAGTQEV